MPFRLEVIIANRAEKSLYFLHITPAHWHRQQFSPVGSGFFVMPSATRCPVGNLVCVNAENLYGAARVMGSERTKVCLRNGLEPRRGGGC
jgi:hypothetical protein